MILGVDIGGTKTLLAYFGSGGELKKEVKFPTAQDYSKFLEDLVKNKEELGQSEYSAGCVAIPGVVDRDEGVGIRFGNLGWKNTPIQADFEKVFNCPIVVENDAKAAGLSEALIVIKDFKNIIYVTIGTGIGVAYIHESIIEETFGDRGGNRIMLERGGKLRSWESFASGKAILRRFGKRAEEITDADSWKQIAHDFSLGILELIALFETDAVIIGGGIGRYFDRFNKFLESDLKKYETPIMPIPPILRAKRPEEAVIYGCYQLAKDRYGSRSS